MRNLRPVPAVAPRAVIYLRQSTFRDDSISLELQEIACRDHCDRMGYDVTAVEADPGISGRTWNRPAVQRVMQRIEDRSADVIVLWKWSRLSRSRKDWALAADRVDVAGGRIESATEPIDTATASGRFARGVMTEYAAFQSEQIGEQWEEVRQRRLRLGLPASGRLPFGWRWLPGGGIEPNPEQAPLIPEMYRRYLAGQGAASIAQWLNTEGVPGPNGNHWSRVRPLTVLDSPIHAGLIPYRGTNYPGAHEGLIPLETWEAYHVERERRRTTGEKPRQADHLLSGLMVCECGARMFGKGSVTGGKWYGGYLCSDTLRGHPQRAYVSARRIDPVVTSWLMEFDVGAQLGETDVAERARRDRLLRRGNELEAELVAAGRGSLKDDLPPAAYQRLVAELRQEYDAVNADIRKIDRTARAVPTVDEMKSVRQLWVGATVGERNLTLRRLVTSITVVDEQTARLEALWGESSLLHL